MYFSILQKKKKSEEEKKKKKKEEDHSLISPPCEGNQESLHSETASSGVPLAER